jgi:hypothetical protein
MLRSHGERIKTKPLEYNSLRLLDYFFVNLEAADISKPDFMRILRLS